MEDIIKQCRNAVIICATVILVASTFVIIDITAIQIVTDIVRLKQLIRSCI